MELKRLYKKDNDGNVVYEKVSNSDALFPVVTGVQIKRLPNNGLQKFSAKLVKVGIKQGWLTVDGDMCIIIFDNLTGKNFKFKITDVPGYECLHCHNKIESDRTGSLVRAHIKTEHKGKPSPDPKFNPSGYVYKDFYATEVEV